MPIVGIVSEFNPFHLGHTVPMAAARRRLGPDTAVVCVMSGNCVQRGDLAIFHKLARAEAAVRCGANLVVELPAPYVLGSAEFFARGAVGTLQAMGLGDMYLAFGCEREDGAGLTAAALALENPATQGAIRENLREGVPYGAACQKALDGCLPPDQSALARRPNNLLAIEYIRAIHRLGAEITPLPVRREAVDHDSGRAAGEYASATHIRSLIHLNKQGDPSPWAYVPDPAAAVFRRELEAGRGPAGLHLVDAAVLTALRLHSAPPAGGFLDDSEGLAGRIVNMAARAGSLEELVELTKTKRYHASRIRRLILKMCLGLGAEDRPAAPPYIKILAADETGRTLIRQMDKTAALPVVTGTGQIRAMDAPARRMVTIESAVTDLMALCFRPGPERRGGGEWRRSPYIARD